MFFKAVFFSLVVAKLRGGRLNSIGSTQIQSGLLAIIAVTVQLYVRSAGPRNWPSAQLAPLLYILGYLSLFVMLWQNRRLPGFWLITLGAAFNFMALSLNGGRMPVSPGALIATGWPLESMDPAHNFSHQLATPHTVLPWLGDVIPINIPLLPRWLSTPMPLSPGDLIQNAGAFWFLQVVSGAGLRKNRLTEEVTK